ncbi:MAG: hypothetical protein ACK4SL_01075 [Candidatus Paceibacteria bacterium]
MENDMLARIIGLGFIPNGVVLILLYTILSKGYDWIQPTEWFEKKLQKVNKGKILIFSKIFLFGVLVLFLPLSLGYFKDVVLVKDGLAPMTFIATISDIRVGKGALNLYIYFDDQNEKMSAYYFSRNTFEEGYTYKFWYLPNTRQIVKAELISTNETQ